MSVVKYTQTFLNTLICTNGGQLTEITVNKAQPLHVESRKIEWSTCGGVDGGNGLK